MSNDTDPASRLYHSYAARLALGQRRFPDAEQSATAALRLSQLQAIDPEASIFVGEDLLTHAQALAGLGDTNRTRTEARRAMALIEKVGGHTHPLHDRARALAF